MQYPGGTPSQPEIIAIALSKLKPKTTDAFADIGCGSGSVSIAASPFVKHVYAIDDREEAILATKENIKDCGIKTPHLNAGIIKASKKLDESLSQAVMKMREEAT